MNDFLNFYKSLDGALLDPKELRKCAESLLCNHYIKKGNDYYQIAEIEFYFYSPSHPDIITYHRQCEEGLWFFHSSGVDITIDSTGIEFGGILIRSIINKKGEKICGPQNCVDELFNYIDINGKPTNIPQITNECYPFNKPGSVKATQRYIPFYIKKTEVNNPMLQRIKEEERYQQLINSKVEKKYQSIINKNKKDTKTKDIFSSLEDFKHYLIAPYRFYIEELETIPNYKTSPNPFAKDVYQFLYKG